VAVYQYVATGKEDYEEAGTVVAQDEEEARRKLKALQFQRIRLKKVGGISGIFRKITADIK
jgi:type II secretory pathway component PulF